MLVGWDFLKREGGRGTYFLDPYQKLTPVQQEDEKQCIRKPRDRHHRRKVMETPYLSWDQWLQVEILSKDKLLPEEEKDDNQTAHYDRGNDLWLRPSRGRFSKAEDEKEGTNGDEDGARVVESLRLRVVGGARWDKDECECGKDGRESK